MIKLHIIKIKRKTRMTSSPDWHKPKIKPYLHQISLDCIEKLVECQVEFNKGEIDVVKHRAEQCFATLV